MQAEIQKAIVAALEALNVTDVDFVVEHPADISHGDYATNVALVSAKKIGKNPREVAEQLRVALEGKIPQVKAITVAGPGFINFTLSREFFTHALTHILHDSDTWGQNDSWKGKKVLVEYTDPNPFKEFHVGHLFTNTVGESIARLFIMNGAEVKRLNYGSDVGLHVAHALWGMKELGITLENEFTARDLGRAYAHGATAYTNEEPRAVLEIRDINKRVYEGGDPELQPLYEKGRAISIAYFKEMYALLDSAFDAQFFESEVAGPGKALVLAHPELFPESDGAHVFKGEEYGLHTRVFLNKEGLPTYEAKELALAKLKEDCLGTYDWSVISTANEITEYFKVLKKAMSFIYPELAAKTEHIGHGMVRLSSGKMSSRTGNVIPAIEFIDEVADAAAAKMDEGGRTAPTEVLARDIALGAIKYATLKGSILQDAIFDKEKALSFEGDSGPYLQYTHARIVSVLEKAQDVAIVPNTQVGPVEAYPIEKILYRFEEVVRAALEERAPHKVTGYLIELAGAFNSFYGEEKIADAADAHAPYKAAIADAVRITLKNGLWTLGIKAPQRM
jgi:arginyl-tRNA synthetase